MTGFGDFQPLCSHTPSYTWCNLFYRQLQDLNSSSSLLTGLSADSNSAPVGINPTCGIPRVSSSLSNLTSSTGVDVGTGSSLGNIANIVVCGLSIPVLITIIYFVSIRRAAVARVEMRALFAVYLLSLILQIITNGGLLQQGTTALVVLTSIHAGVVAGFFWMLLANAVVSTQVVDDGSWASLMPFSIFTVAFFAATTYVSLDVALGITDALGPSNNPSDLRSIPLFVLTSLWPAVAALIYFILMIYIVLRILNETKPLLLYIISAVLFVLSQLAWFLLGRVVCDGSNARVDGSFIATVLETGSVLALFFAWRSITEESWDDPQPYYDY